VLRGGSVHGGGLGVGGAHGAFCKFSGLDVVGASFDGEGSARCLTPRALRPGAVGVRLVQGEAVLVTSVSFVYHADLAVQSVEPVVGLLGGGTRVIVRGHGFDPSTPLVVRVGLRAVVSGRVLSSTMLECTTPSQMLPGPLALEVSQNAQDFTTDEVLFEYQGGLRLDELAPSRGPVSGGTSVAILGEGFARRSAELGYTHARFNMTRVPTVWESSSELRAVVPEHAAGLVSVAVTQNDQQYSGSLHFEYEDVAPHSIAPRAGPLRGGTTVVLRGGSVHGGGLGVGGAHGAFCKFSGLDVVGASFDGEGSARCITPVFPRPGAFAAALYADSSMLASFLFSAFPHPEITSFQPAFSDSSPGTTVTIFGRSLDSALHCSFQSLTRPSLRFLTIASSSPTQVTCSTPFLAPRFYSLEVSFQSDEVCHAQRLLCCQSPFSSLLTPFALRSSLIRAYCMNLCVHSHWPLSHQALDLRLAAP
jgi:hypothetical protein